MSHIEIQATRSAKSNDTPQGREKYLLPNADSNSTTPLFIGSMIMALALYLKSIVVFDADKDEPDRNEQDSPKSSLKPDSDVLSFETTNAKSPESSPVENSIEEAGSNIRLFSSTSSGAFALFQEREPFPVQYIAPHRQDYIKSGQPVAFPVLPSNDNRRDHGSNDNDVANIAGATNGAPTGTDEDGDDSDEENTTTTNRRPTVSQPVVLYDQFACMAVLIALSDLLRGASDPDGDQLQVRNATVSSGELVLVENGYQFHGELTGPITVTYQVSDGTLFVLQTATFNLLDKPPIVGTSDDDNLLGTMCCDSIFGLSGNDQIDGRGGDDEIVGGAGNDHIVGGDGDDIIFGDEGDDIIFGGAGNDHISGGYGHDRLFGGSGDDIIAGDAGDDLLVGGEGDDTLVGGDGNDYIEDGRGNDHVEGESGNDTFIAASDTSNDFFSGGEGIDRLEYSESVVSLTFVSSEGTVTGAEGGQDQFASIEVLVGGQADDQFFVDESPVLLNGGAGNDIFEIVSPPVTTSEATVPEQVVQHFAGGEGIDVLDYSSVDGSVHIDVVNETATGEAIATDTFEQMEHFIGTNGNDSFIVGQGTITLDGHGGDDMFEFLTTTIIENESRSEHHIVGFNQGDWVRMSRYDIFEDAIDSLEDAFDEIYGDDSGISRGQSVEDEVVPIRIRHEVSNDVQKTFIDADFNYDNIYEISVQLDGNHNLLIINNHLA